MNVIGTVLLYIINLELEIE